MQRRVLKVQEEVEPDQARTHAICAHSNDGNYPHISALANMLVLSEGHVGDKASVRMIAYTMDQTSVPELLHIGVVYRHTPGPRRQTEAL